MLFFCKNRDLDSYLFIFIGEVTAAGLEGQDLESLILALKTREAYTTEPYYI